MSGNDQTTRPLTFASPVVTPAGDLESGGGGGGAAKALAAAPPPPPPSRGCCGSRRRCLIWCGGCCGATVVILGLLALILALTVFKVKDPELSLNALYLDNIDAGFRDPSNGLGTLLSVNATITADMSIKNPNAASFRFANSSTEIAYNGDVLGVAYVPAGNAKAHRTARMNVTVEVLADKLSSHPNITTDIFGGDLRLSSFTEIGGRVNVLGIYKKHLDLQLRCNLTIAVFIGRPENSEIKRKDCRTKVV